MFRPVPVLDIRSWAQGQDLEDSEVRVAWWEHQCSHPAVIWYHQYRVKPSSIFCSIPIINCLPHQEPGRIPKWIWASSDTLDLSRRLKMHPDILNKWGWRPQLNDDDYKYKSRQITQKRRQLLGKLSSVIGSGHVMWHPPANSNFPIELPPIELYRGIQQSHFKISCGPMF